MANTLHLPVPDRRPFFEKNGQWYAYKDDDSAESYVMDWTQPLNGETISSVTFTASGVTLTSNSNTTTTTTMLITGSGGDVEIKATTSASRILVKTLNFLAREH